MAKASAAKRAPAGRVVRLAPRDPRALGPGLHMASIARRDAGGACLVRLASGGEVMASIADHVEPGLVDECLRTSKPVILTEGSRGPLIVGALQTARAITCAQDGSLDVSASEIRLRADRGIVLEAGEAALRLERAGLVRMDGEKVLIDASSIVRVLAACVELP